MIKARRAVKDDIFEIVKLIELFNDETRCFSPVGGVNSKVLTKRIEELWEILRVWVCLDDENLISVLMMAEHTNLFSGKKSLEELVWYTKPEGRGQKCSLLDLMESYAEKEGVYYTTMGLMNYSDPENLEKYYFKRGYKLIQFNYVKKLGVDYEKV